MSEVPKLVYSRDEIETFIPESPKLVILGTMAAVMSRRIEGLPVPIKPFYYHDNRNKFWKIMQIIFDGIKNPEFPERGKHREDLLEKWQVAVANVTYEVMLPDFQKKKASDNIILDAHKAGLVKVKTIEDDFKSILRTTPTFFSRKTVPEELKSLLRGYYSKNGLSSSLVENISFLSTPAYGEAQDRAEEWRVEFRKRGVL